MSEPNCPLATGLRPCQHDIPRCPKCNYTDHDARFELDHSTCGGLIPPLPIVVHCPKCGVQHIDVDDDTGKWASSRIHRRHLCKIVDGGCGNVWEPFDYPTVGVAEIGA